MQLKAQKEALELQQQRVEFEKEMALKQLELMQKAQNDANKTRVSESKELINALDKINNLSKLQ